MAGGSKQQYKQFEINTVEDACLVLQTLISGVITNLRRYKQYSAEAMELLEKTSSKYVPAEQYESVKDKLLYRQHEILKFIADHQSSSFSYIDLRKILLKKGLLKTQLSEELKQLLNELLDIRNWTFHNPQSQMVATREAMEKNIPDWLKEIAKVTPQLNPVVVPVIDRYEIVMLVSFVSHTKMRISQFEDILDAMKADYQTLYDSLPYKTFVLTQGGASTEIQYIEHPSTSSITDMSSDIAQISMAIQKSKYDGTDEKFNEWVLRFDEKGDAHDTTE